MNPQRDWVPACGSLCVVCRDVAFFETERDEQTYCGPHLPKRRKWRALAIRRKS